MEPAIREALDQGGSVVTATRRLSRELRRQYDQAMEQSGLSAWESPDILPWDAWLRRCWDSGPGEMEGAPLVLVDSQLHLVWQELVTRDIARLHRADSPLWNIEATAGAAIASLRLMREWGITRTELALSRHPDHAAFHRWLQAYERRCERQGWIDRYQLADRIAAGESAPDSRPVVLTGFDFLTPQQDRLVTSLRDRGAAVEVHQPQLGDFGEIPCHVYENRQEQWFAAAAWALNCLAANPAARIAIVVPDLAACRDDLIEALTETLAPHHGVNPGESRDLPFHVSLGDRLDKHPMARGLLAALTALTADELTLEHTESLLLSPVIGDHANERLPRASAALTLRQRLSWSHGIDDLLRELDGLDCPQFLDRLTRARARSLEATEKTSLSALSAVITALIDDIGWPGNGIALDSDQFQAREAIREQVLLLSGLEMVHAGTTLAHAVILLVRNLASTTFQPEAPDAAVEVLDIREAAGLHFDHVWFADLTADLWPPPGNSDPFIPISVQREAGCPGTEVSRDSGLAARQHARLAASTPSLWHSRPVRDGDTELMPSPLLRKKLEAQASLEKPDPAPTLAARIHGVRCAIETVEDNTGPPRHVGAAAGGTGLIQRQSACPRSAFLRDRLGAGDHLFNQPGLDPARRGILVHRVLDAVWRKLENSARLSETDEAALDELLRKTIAAASHPERRISGCGDAFFRTQQAWLLDTLREWFALERARAEPFEVVAREEKVELQLEGLELQFKVDRMDRFEDGSLALIDYKTGGGQSIRKWFSERPEEPQLPLYVLSQAKQQAVSVVAFARVRLGECVLDGLLDPDHHGISEGLGDHPGLKVSSPDRRSALRPDFAHWRDHAPHWQAKLGALAGEFLAGDARINPGNGGVCPHCPTPAFCRSAGGWISDDEHGVGDQND